MLKALFLLFSVASMPYTAAHASDRGLSRPQASNRREGLDSGDSPGETQNQAYVYGFALNAIIWITGLGVVANKNNEDEFNE